MDLYVKADLIKILSFFYRTMIASAPLLRFAISLSDGELRSYYQKHLQEEIGHDIMQLNDLRQFGIGEPERFHYAAQFAGSQYYLIAHDHPALLLGYMRALENETMPVEKIENLESHHGIELKTLRHHSIHDIAHKEDLDAQIALLDPQLMDRVAWNEANVRQMLMTARI